VIQKSLITLSDGSRVKRVLLELVMTDDKEDVIMDWLPLMNKEELDSLIRLYSNILPHIKN